MTDRAEELEHEASDHWRREAEVGTAMLAAIHAGLGLVGMAKGGISAQDVLDSVARKVEETRQEERKALVKWSLDRCSHCQAAVRDYLCFAAIRAREEKR